ncbi:E1 ubiquitin-activating enzyme [Caenorhabditis elegans]|uniref:E1 ubiquitin-activating enzyme n=1 Tax=Caenorhabditis elegans TaxID=6239 RepID=C1P636_CAEEL|nr:Ubiquitin-activating enzyme E1 C-terminal domain-containing protein [Caenorhabditis elegans]CAX65051.1 Ubiquitin-activating enzyme E1 C-terminal domain-containing protein [Caenorhabditis elegans]|eukprot:NP_001255449.1 UBA (human ubiquitin) related [Caenorhabditis elegans]
MTTILELTSANKTNNKATNNKLQREGENEYPPAKRSKTDDEEEPTVVGNGTIVGAPKQQTLSGVNSGNVNVETTKNTEGQDGEKMDTSNNAGGVGGNSDELLDKNLYSRQIYTLGESAMVNLRTASVLISGLGSVGVEIAKNLILGGVRHVTIHDTKLAKWSDLSAQYYLRDADVGHNRATSCYERLAELNDSVNVQVSTDELTEEFVKTFDLVVLTDAARTAQRQIAAWTRAHNRRILITDARGVFSYIFNDFGDNFRIDDATGEQVREFFIEHIDKTTGEVTTLENLFHGLEDGDHVTFSEVKGLTEINGCEPLKITVKNASKFNIGDFAVSFSDYKEGGRCRQVKVPTSVSHVPFEKSLVEPEFGIWDYAKFEYPSQLHALWTALYAFEEKYGRSPAPRSTQDAALLKELIPSGTEEIPEKLIELFSFSASGNLVTVSSVVGGIAAQEAMKGVTHHMTPLKQWLHLDHVEVLPGDWTSFDNSKLSETDCQPRQSRYDGQAAVFGWPYQECLFRQRWFVVGAGAIGCELLKNLSMMGVACGEGGLIKITDMDQIEISNLNRQFLFRRRDVGGKKSECAARAVTAFNSDVRIEALAERVGLETEHIFNDEFFGELNGVANALDNVDARRYMDRRCVYYRLPLLESGTMGTKGNTQVVYPYLTESYSSSVDPPEKEIPVCTLKNFPNEIQHTIQWAREQFETFFAQPGEMANKFLSDERGFNEHVDKLISGQQIDILQKVKDALIDARPSSAEDCIRWARNQFQELYHNNIAQMLHSFPPDQLTDSGAKFWSGAKRCPHVLNFDPSKEEHFNFVFAASILIAELYGVQPILDREEVIRVALSVNPEPFEPKSGVKIAVTDAEAKEQNERGASSMIVDDDAAIEALKLKLATLNVKSTSKLNCVDFEKDDDSNHHMEFITAASNLRAENYDILPADRMRTKQIAGKIIPAIATTTAAVAGLVCIELYKVVDANGIPKTPMERFKNTFLNLSMPFFSSAEPIGAPKKTYMDREFTLWDRIDVQGPLTLQEFIDNVQNQTGGCEVSMLSAGACLLFSFFMNAGKKQERLKTEVKAVYEELLKKSLHPSVHALVLEPMMSDPDGEDVEVPYIRYSF